MLRVGTAFVQEHGPFAGRSTLRLPVPGYITTDFIVNDQILTEGKAYLASYNPQDQFCTVVSDSELDKIDALRTSHAG